LTLLAWGITRSQVYIGAMKKSFKNKIQAVEGIHASLVCWSSGSNWILCDPASNLTVIQPLNRGGWRFQLWDVIKLISRSLEFVQLCDVLVGDLQVF